MSKTSANSGFSLIELIVLIAILALLSLITFGVIDGARKRGEISLARAEISSIEASIFQFRTLYGQFPIVDSGSIESRGQTLLSALSGETNVDEDVFTETRISLADTSILKTDPSESWFVDPWGNPYYYAFDESWVHGQFFLISGGPDGLIDAPDSAGNYNDADSSNIDNVDL